MFEAEYARRRTTAEAEAGRICPGTPSIWRAARCSQWTLPPPSTGGRRSSTVYGCSTTLPLESLALLTDPACGDAFQIESIFYNTYQQEAQRLGRVAFLPNHLRKCGQGLDPRGAEYDCLVLHGLPYGQAWLLFPGRARPALMLEVAPPRPAGGVEVASCAPRIFGVRDPPCLPGGRHCGVRPLPRRPFHPSPR